jgi:histidinol phosphatase-like enzyme
MNRHGSTIVRNRVRAALEDMNNVCHICLSTEPHEHKFEGTDRWIAVDLDGTLAKEKPGRTDPYEIGEPIPEMVERVKRWLALGLPVKLFTARMAEYSVTSQFYRDLERMELVLRAWCKEHIGQELECTNKKDGGMEVLWDDRAVQVARNLGVPA